LPELAISKEKPPQLKVALFLSMFWL